MGGGCSEAQEGLEGSHGGPAPVEPERDLMQIGLEVFVADLVVRPAEPRLEVAKGPGGPRQQRAGAHAGTLETGATPDETLALLKRTTN
jgi:hypothetical protein